MPASGLRKPRRRRPELKREIEALKSGQVAIQRDLAEIKNLLLQREVQNLRDELQARPGAPGAPAPGQAGGGAAQETLTVVGIEGVIHDGARPFLTPDLIRDGLKTGTDTGAAIAAVPVKDTIKLANAGNLVKETPRRDRLWAAQTPQIFSLDIITRAYKGLIVEVTDDAAAVERIGHAVKVYMGDHKNIKVTTREDLALAGIIAGEWKQKS